MDTHRIVVIGASEGGHAALKEILKNIPADINASFIIVQHISADSSMYFGRLLAKAIKLKVKYADHQEPIQKGTVYLSVPDHHVLVDKGQIILSKGPTENLTRPAIDPLFRTCAVAYGHRAIGVILTGRLNDGTSGLAAVKACGGITVVQNPKSAEYPEMPNFALQAVKPNYCCRLDDMGTVLEKLIHDNLPPHAEAPPHIQQEAEISKRIASMIDLEDKLGDRVPYGCPECGGPLWQMKNDQSTTRFRCHTGHGYTAEALMEGQVSRIEESLWVALRTLEERVNILKKSHTEHSRHESKGLMINAERKIKETQRSIDTLRKAMNIQPPQVMNEVYPSVDIQDCN